MSDLLDTTCESLNFKESSLDRDDLLKECRENFYFFTKGILGYDWIVPHIHKPLCDSLQNRKTNRRLFVLPRGWLKTTLCTVAYPMWRSILDPNIRILITQNSATNALKKLSIIKGQWESNVFLRWLYPELLPTSDSTWRSDAACLNRSKSHPEATYEAAGTNTKVVSRHYDVIIEDDTVAPDLDELGMETIAPTSSDVEKAIGWHRTNVIPLLNNPSEGDVLVVGTRWYELDLIAWIMQNEPQYEIITRACREDDEGKPDIHGAVVYPERFDEDTLRQIETSLGPYLFSCLYMNLPVRLEDMLFKPAWIKYYETPPPGTSLEVFTTIDPATDPELAKGRDIDYSVVMTCGKDMINGGVFVLEYTRKRMNPGELVQEVFRHVVTHRPIKVGYEDVAFQRALEYYLRELMRQEQLYFMLEAIPTGGRSKTSRVTGLQPLFAAGVIYIRDYMKELEAELLAFPLGRYDDVVDALAMQLHFWGTTSGPKLLPAHEDDHPLSFERALAEIKARKSGGLETGPVFDTMRIMSNRSVGNALSF